MATELERKGLSRRRLFILGNFAATGLLGTLVAIPLIGYILGAIGLRQPIVRVRIAPMDSIPVGVPTAFKFTVPVSGSGVASPRTATVYVLRTGTETTQNVFTFYSACTHMGCPVRWDPIQSLYRCPCHGGIYDLLGRVVHGPPPYALRQFRHEITDGVLYVYNSVMD